MGHSDDGRSGDLHKVTLPSGRVIEVQYFYRDSSFVKTSRHKQQGSNFSGIQLHICPECDSDLVYPTEWDEAGGAHWEVVLRCPNCEWTASGIFEQDVIDEFDFQIDCGTEALMRDLNRLIHIGMSEDIERIIDAIYAGHILPEDF